MKFVMTVIARLATDQKGVTAIEYAFLASLVSVSFVVVAGSIGDRVLELLDMAVAAFG